MSKNKVLITHSDFDGVTCAILFKAVYQDGIYYLENYDTVDERIKEVLQKDPLFIYITDISPQSEEVIRLLDQFGKALLFDHHKTAFRLNSYSWARLSPVVCGAVLFSNFLRNLMQEMTMWQYEQLVFHANDYDLWIHSDHHSSVLNSFLYTIGHERFINRFLQNPSVELTEAEKYLLEIEKEKEEKYVQEAVEAAKIYDSLAVTVAERYTSQIGHKMLETLPIDIAVIVNAQNR